MPVYRAADRHPAGREPAIHCYGYGVLAYASSMDQPARLTEEARKHALYLREIVLEVGAEGGSITLLRERRADENWQFQMKTDETALYDALSEEDRNGMDFVAQTGYVHSFNEALALLDRYQWFSLCPLKVHPELLDAVLLKVRKRGGPTEEARWREELKHR